MVDMCLYCSLDTGGNHETNCPNSPTKFSTMNYQRVYDAADHDKRIRAEVMAACIKEAKEHAKHWCDEGDLPSKLEQLQPTAEALEALLREERIKERLCVLGEYPGLCNGDTDNPERHSRCCKYHQELDELEKARASEEKK